MKISEHKLGALTGAVVLILALFVMWLGHSHAQEKGKGAGSDAIAQLYAAAKKEGSVIIWGPTDAIIYQKIQTVQDKQ